MQKPNDTKYKTLMTQKDNKIDSEILTP